MGFVQSRAFCELCHSCGAAPLCGPFCLFYGFSGSSSDSRVTTHFARNESALRSCLAYAKGFGDTPFVFAMGPNDRLEHSVVLSQALRSAAAIAHFGTSRCLTTYASSGCAKDSVGTSRIDFLLVNNLAETSLVVAETCKDQFLGQHRAFSATFDLAAFRATEMHLVGPKPFDLPALPSEVDSRDLQLAAEGVLASSLLSEVSPLSSSDTLNLVASAFLARCVGLKTCPSLHRKGCVPKFVARPRLPPVSDGAALPRGWFRASTFLRFDKVQVGDLVFVLPRHLRCAWRSVGLGDWTSFISSLAHRTWQHVVMLVQKALDDKLRGLRKARQNNWKAWLRNSQRHVWSWLKSGSPVESDAVIRDDDRWTADPDRIRSQLLDKWAPYLLGPRVSFGAFAREYSREIAETALPVDLPDVTVDDMRKAKRSIAVKGGTDGWCIHELRRLPTCILEAFLRFLHMVERQQVSWPAGLVTVATVLLPKPEGGHRPICVTSLWISAFCSARFAQLSGWQSRICPASLVGGLSGRSAAHAEVPMAFWLDLCERRDKPALGITHDRRKCFDLIKAPSASKLLAALGLPGFFVDGFVSRYASQRRCFKYLDPAVPTSFPLVCCKVVPFPFCAGIVSLVSWHDGYPTLAPV